MSHRQREKTRGCVEFFETGCDSDETRADRRLVEQAFSHGRATGRALRARCCAL